MPKLAVSLRSRAASMAARPSAASTSWPVVQADSTCPVALRNPAYAPTAAAAYGEM